MAHFSTEHNDHPYFFRSFGLALGCKNMNICVCLELWIWVCFSAWKEFKTMTAPRCNFLELRFKF